MTYISKKGKTKKIAKKKTENSIVVMDNRLIISKWHTNLIETKLVLYVISVFNSLKDAREEYRIPVKPFLNLTDMGENYDLVKTVAKNLSREILEVPKINEQGKKVYTYYPVFSKTEYVENKGYIDVAINVKVKPYLFNLNREFTRFYLKNVAKMGSMYSIRLYELLKQYENFKSREFEVTELRDLLAVKPDEYKMFKHFEDRILRTAVREINEKTDLFIDYWKLKSGRSIEKISFTIDKNPNNVDIKSFDEIIEQEEEEEKIEIKANDELKKLLYLLPETYRTKQSQDILSRYLKAYRFEYIAKQIEYANKQNPRNYFGYLVKSIEGDYADAEIAELEKQRIQKVIEHELKNAREEIEHDISVKVDNEKFKIYDEYMNLLNEAEKQALQKEYLKKAKEIYPNVDEKSFYMELKIQQLITEDIINRNEIYQKRLSNVEEQTKEKAEKEFERIKKSVLARYEQIEPKW